MSSMLITAFILGAIGSMHCVGMCGPLAMSLPVVSTNPGGKMLYSLLYNLGRMLTYAVLGALLGLIGVSLALMGFQQYLSIGAGAVILVYLFWPHNKLLFNSNAGVKKYFTAIRQMLSGLFTRKQYTSVFFIGLLNGLLPCGLVYLAIAGAVSMPGLWESSLFMAAFGLGTLPLMWSVAFFGSFINLKTSRVIRKTYPYLMFLMACLLIIRGFGLGIPFMSPELNVANNQAQVIECYDIK